MIPFLSPDSAFPAPARALRHPNGLLAAGGDLSSARLLDAYRHGIFPWYNADEPILWWSPDPRMVLFPARFKCAHSLQRTLRRHAYEVRIDSAFEQVMQACAAPRRAHGDAGSATTASGTWISPDMIAAYADMHRLGYAHTVEVWMDDELAGGLYGIALGRMFYGESMFSLRTDASKIALAHLCAQLARWNFGMIDCQMHTPHLASLGAVLIPRNEFILRLQDLINYAPVTDWNFDRDLFP